MFSSATNPYDDLIAKATDEGHVEAPWGDFVEISDKIEDEGETGARNAVLALQKQLSHRNPNVQMYALDLANYLVLNGGRTTYKEISSRGWTGALDRLINERTTAPLVKKKALSCVKSWTATFEETRDPNLGVMTELFDSLKAKNFSFDEPEPVPQNTEDIRLRQEEEELARVLELSKQDKGGRYQPSATGGSTSSAYQSGGTSHPSQSAVPIASPQHYGAPSYQAQVAQAPPPPQEVDINTATRVRALYSFATTEVGELPFERGDVIKVLDRGFKEWWRGASGGRIGIFPTTYVEAMPDPSPAELAEEAQEEAKVFASLGMVDQLLKLLKGIDPARGDRVDDVVEIEDLYQSSVALQSQITALIKKYGDQKAELEHMNANFLRAMRSYEGLRNPQPVQAPVQAPYAPQQYAQQPYPSQPQQQQPPQQQQQQQQQVPPGWPQPQAQPQGHSPQPQAQAQPQGYYPQQPADTGAYGSPSPAAAPAQPSYPPSELHRQGTEPGQAGIGAGAGQHQPAPQGLPYAQGEAQQQQQHQDPQHAAAWEAYYRQQAQQQQQQPQQPHDVAYGASPYPPAHQGSGDSHGDPAAGLANGVAGMRV